MKKFFAEFKKFITRGNVVDMAVGVIVGSSFTAIVNGLSNNILKPIINWLLALILGSNSLSDIHTVLLPGYNDAGEIDLANSIYIDWGAFINAVINFFLVALVLFCIVKFINKFREGQKSLGEMIIGNKLSKEYKAELKTRGISVRDKDAVEAFLAEKKRLADEEAAAKAKEDEEKAKLEREMNPTTEDLLKKILEELRKDK